VDIQGVHIARDYNWGTGWCKTLAGSLLLFSMLSIIATCWFFIENGAEASRGMCMSFVGLTISFVIVSI
jgi:hypothetical protein